MYDQLQKQQNLVHKGTNLLIIKIYTYYPPAGYPSLLCIVSNSCCVVEYSNRAAVVDKTSQCSKV